MKDPREARLEFERLHHRGDEPHLFREVFRTCQVLSNGFSRKLGMPSARFGLMRTLVGLEGDTGVMDLARRLGINPAAVTRQVQELERDGLVRRRPDARDGRFSYIDISPKGQKMFEKIHGRIHEFENSAAAAIGAEEMRNAARTLQRLRAFVEETRLDLGGIEG